MKREAKSRPEEVLAFIKQKNWPYSLEGDNYKIQYCPYCSNQNKNFEIHKDKGMFKAWCCGEEGSFYTLKKFAGFEPVTVEPIIPTKPQSFDSKDVHEQAAANFIAIDDLPDALNYLTSRGFSEESLSYFKIGALHKDGVISISIPHYVGDRCVNLKYRSMPPEKKWWQSGGKKVLFNQNALENNSTIIIAEGELKAIALWQMGFKNVVSQTQGASTFTPEWVELLSKKEKIYLCLDSDEAGQSNAYKVATKLGLNRCFNIVLPDAKDPDEYFFVKNHTAADFENLMRTAKQYDVKNITSAYSALTNLEARLRNKQDEFTQGILTPWKEVNSITKGFRPGELIILSAPPKFGKSSFSLEICIHLSKFNIPILFFCMEMSAERIAFKILSNLIVEENDFYEWEDVAYTKHVMRHKPFYLPNHLQRMEIDEVLDVIKQAHHRYGLKFVVFDNLHFLCRDITHQKEKLGVATQGFKMLAEELQIPIMLIVHPRKLKGTNSVMTSDDLKDSSSIHADADMVIVMHRQRNKVEVDEKKLADKDEDDDDQILSRKTHIIVDATRYAPGGKTQLYYEGEHSRFRSLRDTDKD